VSDGNRSRHLHPEAAVEIDYLLDHPELVPLVARWKYRQWGFLYPRTLGRRLFPWITPRSWVQGVRSRLGRGGIPTTWVAFCGGKAAGVASLVEQDDSTDARENEARNHLSPWLAGVLVAPAFRKRGVAKALVNRVLEGACALEVPELFLQTFDLADFYERMGWAPVGRAEYEGREVVLMGRKTGPETAG
jgi:GNAT superfamily N-acetyltransferase